MTGPAFRYIRMCAAMTEGTGKCLMLGHCLLHQLADFFVAGHAGCSRRCQGIVNLQRMMGRMATQTIRGHLTLCMGFMTLETIRDLAVYFMAERTGLLRMGTLVIGEILTGAFVTGEARFFYVIGKMQGKWLMGIGMAGQAVLKFKMRSAFMAHRTFWYDIFPPGRMFTMAVKTGNRCLVLAAVTCN